MYPCLWTYFVHQVCLLTYTLVYFIFSLKLGNKEYSIMSYIHMPHESCGLHDISPLSSNRKWGREVFSNSIPAFAHHNCPAFRIHTLPSPFSQILSSWPRDWEGLGWTQEATSHMEEEYREKEESDLDLDWLQFRKCPQEAGKLWTPQGGVPKLQVQTGLLGASSE